MHKRYQSLIKIDVIFEQTGYFSQILNKVFLNNEVVDVATE